MASLWPAAWSFLRADLVVSGNVPQNITWTENVQVTGDVSIAAGATLTVAAGVEVKLAAGVSILAQAGGALMAMGTAARPVAFRPVSGTTAWGHLAARGKGASILLQHADVAQGGIDFSDQATGLLEDLYVHDVYSAIVGNSAGLITLRRVHVRNYSETVFNSGTIILAEDSLFEDMTAPNSDALEIQGGPPGSIIRRCTFRHSSGGNSDAVDFNGTSGVLIQDCLIHDFTDKGISLGAAAAGGEPDRGIIVSNCCIYQVDTGIAIKDGSTCALYHNTIAAAVNGLRLYQKFVSPVEGGHVTNSTGNIIWDTTSSLNLANNSSVTADHSNFQGVQWLGPGNLSVNPLFANAATHDYRLAANSPVRGAGLHGVDLGAHFPVGAPMAPSHPSFSQIGGVAGGVRLRFWADPERTYSVTAADSLKDPWIRIASPMTGPLPVELELTIPSGGAQKFFRIITPGLP